MSTSGLGSDSLSVLTDPSIKLHLVYKGSYLQHPGYNSVEQLSKNISHRREGFQSATLCTQQFIYHLEAAIWWYHKCTSPLTEVQCQEIQEICQDLILSAVDDSTFLHEIIAGDEALCFLWFLNQVWAEWVEITNIPTEDKLLPGLVWRKIDAGCVFTSCLIPKEFILKGPTMNKELYTSFEVLTVA
jgi:hypothetical protein